MNAPLPQRQAIYRFTKVFIGQYLSSVHNFESFQDESLNLLSVFLIQMMKSLALKVKSILNLQGRTLPNSLHLLVTAEQTGTYNFQDILEFIQKRNDQAVDLKSLEIIAKLGKMLFQNDLQSINNYPKESTNPNIRHVPPVFVMDIAKVSLPYRHPIDEVFPLPPQVTYQQTRQKVVREKKNIQHLASYTKRQTRIALVGRMLQNQDEKNRQKKNLQSEQAVVQHQNETPSKKLKFDLVSFL